MARDTLSPRRAPRQDRSRSTVDAIFEAMIELAEKRALDEPSVQAIADRAGVSVGSIYQYFPSKGALANALLRYHLRSRMDALEAALAQVRGLDAELAARTLIDGLVGTQRTRSRIEQAMLRYFCRNGDLGSLTEMDERMNALVETFLRSLGPAVRPVDPALAAFLVSNALRSAVLLGQLQRPELLEQPAFKDELARLVVGYLKP